MTRIAFGIATIGRWSAIVDLLADLEAQSSPPDLVVICSQDGMTPVVRASFPLLVITSAPGASRGRNATAQAAVGRADYIQFLNDNSRLEPHFVDRLRSRITTHDAYAMRMVDALGPRNVLPSGQPGLDRHTVTRTIEPATALRLDSFLDAGGFDPDLGPGAATPWQCGEIVDLLLRMDERSADFSIEWVPELVVQAETEYAHLTTPERHRKIRAYNRANGFIHRRWRYPLASKLRYLAGGALLFARKPGRFTIADSWLAFVGRLEGLTGRVFSRSRDYRSVVR